MDCVKPIVDLIDKYLISPFVQEMKHLTSSNENVKGLQTIVQNLMARRKDEQSTLKGEENAGKVKTDVASNWFQAVHEIEMEANAIEKEYDQATCPGGDWWVKYCSCYRLSKRSVDLKQMADDRLKEEFVLARPVSSAKSVIKMPTEPIENQSFSQLTLKEMLDCLGDSDPHLDIIGVYGMGGVGKTTLAKQVNNHFENDVDSCFQIVIMVTVSATPKIQSIQTNISKRLQLPEGSGAEALFDALRKKKFLLILDDVWHKLELGDVGIPHPRDGKFGSKILVTSRIQDTCTDMGAKKTIKVQTLSKEESWGLFVEVAGGHVAANDIKCFAEKLVGRCKGLPLAIVTVARAMANRRGVGVWENALRSMEQSAKDLRDGDYEYSLRMHDMMRELGLWITSSSEYYSDSSPKFLTRSGKSVKEAPKAHEWVDATRVSLLNTQIEKLPELGETCQKLTTFLFTGNNIFTVIPSTNFFQHMDHLSVLDLSCSDGLEFLPNSLSCLVNLRVLRLQWCKVLRALPEVGMLQKLQVLGLHECEELEQEILGSECVGSEGNLRYLDVEMTKVSIPVGVISRLHKLEELRLFRAENIKWRVSAAREDEKWEGSSTGSEEEDDHSVINNISKIDVEELVQLTNLTSLSISLEGITISDRWFEPLAKKFTQLELKHCRVIEQDALQALNKSPNLRDLQIEDCPGLTCVPATAGSSVGGINVKISDCEDLENVFDGADRDYYVYQQGGGSFVKELTLVTLPKLERIYVGLPPPNCFAQLSVIRIRYCNKLKMVFTKGMPRLNNLKYITVRYCHEMEAIIEEEEVGEELEGKTQSNINGGVVISPFPKLKWLWLQDLPALHDMCSSSGSSNRIFLHCPLLENVFVTDCPKLKKDPLPIRNADGFLVIDDEEGQWRKGYKVMEEEIQVA
ncbi:probable disease resistance protein At1g61190 [Macadamia integrifolia]|uniref:probable disease resistance protein At1g61190 n=1 Tax=Macadamia integrifolia TaxID=60698 RepID=UPI001C4FFFD9|nr:probable disease resistance protein At1g61190 [Macadamia integrifolia]